MTQEEVAALVVEALEALPLRYAIVGSQASNLHGRPRSTQDVDILIEPHAERLRRLVERLAGAFYVSAAAAEEALRLRTLFNAIHLDSAFKVDLAIRKDRPYDLERLRRRVPGTIARRTAMFSSPEDTILAKLEWSRALGGSERQMDDASGVVEVQGERLDRAYLDRWAAELGVADLLEELRR